MKKRYLYSLLFGVPGFFVSLIVSFIVFGGVAGFFWLFIFGDNPWPSWFGGIFTILFAFIFLIIWAGLIFKGFVTGKKFEKDQVLNKKHLLVSVGLTVVFILFILSHQLSVGNIGPKPDSIRCADFCRQKGYSASGMPPRDSGERDCSCYGSGREVIKIPINSIYPNASK